MPTIARTCENCDTAFLWRVRDNLNWGKFCSKSCRMIVETRKPDDSLYNIDDSGCWLWLGQKGYNGYGRKYIGDKRIAAHKYFFEKYVRVLQKGNQLDHLCKVRHCVNPSHLEEVTAQENIHRSSSTRLSWSIVRQIRSMKDSLSVTELGKTFEVSERHIYDILNNKRWREPNATN